MNTPGSPLRELGRDLFAAESTVRFYGVRVQTRMACARLSDGRLFLYSPVFLTEALRQALDGLGRVAFLVSPNKIHHKALSEYVRAWPDAELHVPPGLAERRPDLRPHAVLGAARAPWGDELALALTAGNVFFCEALFLHRASATLLVGDFVENFDEHTTSLLGRALARLFGVPARPVTSPEFRLYTEDAAAAEAALAVVRSWPFERIFLCHGALVERDARAVFDAVCAELLEAVRRRGAAARWLLRRLAAIQ